MSGFEELYLEVRKKEKRVYSDSEVLQLPDISPTHPHYKEWLIRKASFKQLKSYLEKKGKPLHILDIGCGNGWMTNKLSGINQSAVVGVETNALEAEQARRVFAGNRRLTFFSGDIFQNELLKEKLFDVIILAASIQYFKDVESSLKYLLRLLNEDGEIHILDSHFYTERAQRKAKVVTENYYREIGFEEMEKHYHHHLWSTLEGLNYEVKNRSFKDKVLLKMSSVRASYFPWIIIKK